MKRMLFGLTVAVAFMFGGGLAYANSIDYCNSYVSFVQSQCKVGTPYENYGFCTGCMDTCKDPSHHLKKNSLGWEIYPRGLYDLLIRFKQYNRPLMITENGICIDDDNIRWEYIRGHLKSVHRAMQEGARVLGYLYWSLLDNYEWDKGFLPRFGLVEVDYNSYGRRPRESARKFAAVCTTGRLEDGAD